ncbi:MAG TPA: hypothetical protein PK530_12835 [Anaerolineales bacterium]|nr:hypothetical protein [Anaerolineales bacterium]
MKASNNNTHSYNQKQSSQFGNISKIEAFIISRIAELKQLGWSTSAIADALGVNTDFVETAMQYYAHSFR